MDNSRSSFAVLDTPLAPGRFAWRQILALALIAAAATGHAAEVGDSARRNQSSSPQGAIPWLSGGVGDEARDEMRKVQADYNVLITFSRRQGSYMANVPFTVSAAKERKILSGVSEGPLLYLRLPAGAYRVSAKIDGAWQSQDARAGSPATPVRLMFVGNEE